MTQLLYFSPVAASDYAQRPHFLVRELLRAGAATRVLWVNPHPCRLPRWSDVRRLGSTPPVAETRDRRIEVLDLPALPIEPLPGGPWLNDRLFWRGAWERIETFAAAEGTVLGIGRPSAVAVQALARLRPRWSFFDAMDNFAEFHRGLSRRWMERCEQRVANGVTVVLASSTYIAAKFQRRGFRVIKALNAYPMRDLPGSGEHALPRGATSAGAAAARTASASPTSGAPAPPSTPALGYLGCIGSWFDWRLLLRVAEAVPEISIDLVGPCRAQPGQRLPGNVRLHPACRQSEAAGWLRRWSAGLIPFLNNRLTAGVDPIKYYEYRAWGLPVLATSFGEMALRDGDDGVYFLDRTAELRALVRRALALATPIATTAAFRRQHDWSSRIGFWRFMDGSDRARDAGSHDTTLHAA